MDTLSALWAEFEKRLYDHAPVKLVTLNPPATPAAILNLERLLGAPLPDDFKASLAVHDGGTFGNELADGEELLSIPRIAEEWRIWNDLLKSPGLKLGGQPSRSAAGVKGDWWNPLWVPITSNHAGDHWCLDLDPAPGGRRGQVIRMWHDLDARELGAPDFTAFFRRFSSVPGK